MKQLIFSLWIGFSLFCSLSSCTPSKLNVFSTYVTRESLASNFVGTPDPCLNKPDVGQKLYINWRFPSCYLSKQPLELKLFIRFNDRSNVTQTVPITSLCGTYVYALMNKDFFDHEGFMAYKVEIFGNGILLDEWRHLMWVDLITFDNKDDEADEAEADEAKA